MTLRLILLILAACCFAVAAVNTPTRVNLIALGLLLWLVSLIVVSP